MLDSYGRRVHYLRVSLTDRCNMRCVYCMPEAGVPFIPHERILSLEKIARIVEAASRLGFDKIRLTGGEPLVRKGVLELVSMIRALPGVATLAMTTNGTLLAPVAAELARRGMDSVNVSLDTLDPVRYAELTRGGRLVEAVDGIRAALKAGLPVKINVVVGTDGGGHDLDAIRAFALAEGCGLQTIRQYRLDVEKFDDEGFDRPLPCSLCDRIRLSATGELRPCLHGDAAVPVDFGDIEASIRTCVGLKPPCGSHTSSHLVSAIGG